MRIVARGHDVATVHRVEHLLYLAEYKRRQSAPGVKITKKNFGRDVATQSPTGSAIGEPLMSDDERELGLRQAFAFGEEARAAVYEAIHTRVMCGTSFWPIFCQMT